MLTSIEIARIVRNQKNAQKRSRSGFDSAIKDLGVAIRMNTKSVKKKK